MSTSVEPTSTRTGDRTGFIAAAVVTTVDLVVLVIGLTVLADDAYESAPYGDFLPQDVWQPFALLAWTTALVNGAGLAIWPRTRPVGLGITYATIGVALLMVGYFALAIASMGS